MLAARLHFVGIGGTGMSSLARYALRAGFEVSGSDSGDGMILDVLADEGARVYREHAPANIQGVDRVVISSAIPAHNVELIAAHEAGVPVLHRGRLLAEIVAEHPGGIAVCGTHGKGTTAGALVAMFEAAGMAVSFILGAPRRDTGQAAHYSADADYLVAEVDESDRTHLHHRPRHLLINNVEADHLNVYGSLDAIVEGFASLCQHFHARAGDAAAHAGQCVVGLHGEGVSALRARMRTLQIPSTTAAVGLDADVRAVDYESLADGRGRFMLASHGRELGAIETGLKGALNARNIVSAAALALALGVDFAAIREGAYAYEGLIDRFHETHVGRRLIVTDYTSHPTCMRGSAKALRPRVHGKLHAVFQPFRYSLLRYHLDGYVEALSHVDRVHLAPLDAAGEAAIEGLSEASIRDGLAARGGHADMHLDLASIERALRATVQPEDAVIVFGGGPMFEMARRLARHFETTTQPAEVGVVSR